MRQSITTRPARRDKSFFKRPSIARKSIGCSRRDRERRDWRSRNTVLLLRLNIPCTASKVPALQASSSGRLTRALIDRTRCATGAFECAASEAGCCGQVGPCLDYGRSTRCSRHSKDRSSGRNSNIAPVLIQTARVAKNPDYRMHAVRRCPIRRMARRRWPSTRRGSREASREQRRGPRRSPARRDGIRTGQTAQGEGSTERRAALRRAVVARCLPA